MTPARNRIATLSGLALSFVPWLLAPSTIAPFVALYSVWTVPPPPATRFLIAHPRVLLVLPLLVVAAWCHPRWRGRRGPASLATGLAAAALGYLAMVVLLYWPTFG